MFITCILLYVYAIWQFTFLLLLLHYFLCKCVQSCLMHDCHKVSACVLVCVCVCVCACTYEVTQATRAPNGLIGILVIWLKWNSVSFRFGSDCPQAHKQDLTFMLTLLDDTRLCTSLNQTAQSATLCGFTSANPIIESVNQEWSSLCKKWNFCNVTCHISFYLCKDTL